MARYGHGKTCLNCERPYARLEIHGADDAAAIERRMRDFVDEDYGRDRVKTEEALSKIVLRAIANGAPEPERIAVSMLRILEQKAERLYA
jgi:hypothetical protein